MKNKKQLVLISLLRKIIEIFSNFFLSIYLFKLVDGDFNFILFYAAVNAVAGCVFGYFVMRYISPKNANFIFKSSYICEIISILMLIIFKENLLDVIWAFLLINRYANSSYYAVYETTLIGSAKKNSISSYVAGVNILATIISLIVPALMGFLITDYSYYIVMGLVLIDAIVSIFIATRTNFTVITSDFHPLEYWAKAIKNKNMRKSYLTTFLKRLSGPDGILEYLIPILLFMALGTEFSAGSYDSLFSIGYIILLEVVRIANKKSFKKRFYLPLALLCLTSAIVMVSNFNVSTILIFYFAIKTGGKLLQTESASMIYAIGKKEKMITYTREHQFTWNVFLALGNLVGVLIAFLVYNYFYSKDVFAVIIVVLMVFFVLHAYLLQRLESGLKNK